MKIKVVLLNLLSFSRHKSLQLVGAYLESNEQSSSIHQVYLNVQPVNTASHLEAIRSLNLSTYHYAYERHHSGSSTKQPRLRIGAIGPNVAKVIPEAVELVPKRVLPPLEKGGKPITLQNVPVVDEHTVFMYGIGATKEIIRLIETLKDDLSEQIEKIMHLHGETAKLEHLMSQSSSVESELRLRIAIAEAESLRNEMEIEMQMTKDEEEFIQAQKEAELALMKRNEQLTIERLKREDEVARLRAKEELKVKFESNRRLEDARSNAATARSKIEFEKEVSLRKVSEDLKAESAKKIAEAKASAERANEDVHIRKLKAEAEQKRKRNIAAINAIAGHLADSFFTATKNPKQVILFLWYLTILATGIFTAREMAKFCRVIIESLLRKPKLIRETSRKSLTYQYFFDFIEWFSQICKGTKDVKETRENLDKIFEDVTLPNFLKDRILNLATAASKSRDNNVPHRHILFYGPPGTGKTLVARKLAQCIGMEYAIMSGGDVGPLGVDAVTQIHSLFRWSKFCRKGVILFIDEAEAFLANRSTNTMSENAHNALNALLYNTGTERKDFMMILATNRPEDLDAAVLDRCDESLLFALPDAKCREKLLKHYFEVNIKRMEQLHDDKTITKQKIYSSILNFFFYKNQFAVKLQNDVMNDKQIKRIAKDTDTFSGREIAKLMIAVQGAAYSSDNGTLTSKMIDDIVKVKISDHKAKREMCDVMTSVPQSTDVGSDLSNSIYIKPNNETRKPRTTSGTDITSSDNRFDDIIEEENHYDTVVSVVDAKKCKCNIS